MANYWPGVIADLEAAMGTAWPAIGASFKTVIAKKINWSNLFQAGSLTNDYAVLQLHATQDPEWGACGTFYRVQVSMFYIMLDPGANVEQALLTLLKAMQDYLLSNASPLTTILPLGDDFAIHVGDDDAAQVMIEANTPFTCGSIGFAALVGEGP